MSLNNMFLSTHRLQRLPISQVGASDVKTHGLLLAPGECKLFHSILAIGLESGVEGGNEYPVPIGTFASSVASKNTITKWGQYS